MRAALERLLMATLVACGVASPSNAPSRPPSSLPTGTTIANLRRLIEILRGAGGRHFTVALLPTKIPQFAAVGARLNPGFHQFVERHADLAGVDLWLNTS